VEYRAVCNASVTSYVVLDCLMLAALALGSRSETPISALIFCENIVVARI
jgi:hypothetical protein